MRPALPWWNIYFERHYRQLIISQPCRVQWYVSSLCPDRFILSLIDMGVLIRAASQSSQPASRWG